MQDWKKVYSSNQLATATMVMGLLNTHDIPAKTLNKQDTAYVFLGEVEVYVPADFFEKAVALIDTLDLHSVEL